MQKLEKINERSLRYLKTDHGPRTDGQGQLLRTPSGKPGVQNDAGKNYVDENFHIWEKFCSLD